MNPALLLLIAYGLPIYVVAIQTTHFRESFLSETPVLYWILICVGMCAASMTSSCLSVRPATTSQPPSHPTIGILPYCQKCRAFMYPRTHHCDRCGCCVPRHVGHIELTDKCVGQFELLFIVSGLALSVPYFLVLIGECCYSVLFMRNDTVIEDILGHILLVAMVIPCVVVLIQVVLYLLPLLFIVLSNGMAMGTRKWGIFEKIVVESPCRNPYCRGIFANVGDFLEVAKSVSYPALIEGARTDAYCEDWQNSRGLDLRPTVRKEDEVREAYPDLWRQAQSACCGGSCQQGQCSVAQREEPRQVSEESWSSESGE